MTTVWYIHGAHSSPLSFRWLIDNLPDHDARPLTYSANDPIETTLERFCSVIGSHGGYVVGHSLGGLVGVSLSHMVPLDGVMTISAPFGGCEMAGIMRWFWPGHLFRTIDPYGRFISSLHQRPKVRVRSIVSTGGDSLLLNGINDGVVTYKSQTAVKGPEYVEIAENHSEILLSCKTLDQIKDFVF